MPKFKLSEGQQREVALVRLCGVKPRYIARQWRIAQRTVDATTDEYSRTWNDPLVELYRSDPNRERNSAHLYLAFHGRNVQNHGLVAQRRHIYLPDRENLGDIDLVFGAVDRSVYTPRIDVLRKNTAFGQFEAPRTPHERLLAALYEPGHYLVEEPLLALLEEQYGEHDFSLREIFNNLELQIVERIKNGALAFTAQKEKFFDDIFDRLSEREQQVLSKYFGLDDTEYTLEEIGNSIGRTRERVRQIKEKALLRLRVGLQRYNGPEIFYATIDEVDRYDPAVRPEKPLKHFGELSTRTLNALFREDIKTVGDLVRHTDEQLLRIPEFGNVRLQEIRQFLDEYGLSLADSNGSN